MPSTGRAVRAFPQSYVQSTLAIDRLHKQGYSVKTKKKRADYYPHTGYNQLTVTNEKQPDSTCVKCTCRGYLSYIAVTTVLAL